MDVLAKTNSLPGISANRKKATATLQRLSTFHR